MKGLMKSLAVIAIVSASSMAQANDCPIRTGDGQVLPICAPGDQVRGVPELNAAGAPVALLLLAGLVAIGFERRRSNH